MDSNRVELKFVQAQAQLDLREAKLEFDSSSSQAKFWDQLDTMNEQNVTKKTTFLYVLIKMILF